MYTATKKPAFEIELVELLETQWAGDQSMVKYCLTSANYINMGEYYLNIGDRPNIDSTIYYDDETARPDSKDFEIFRRYNIRHNGHRSIEEYTQNGRKKIFIYTNSSRDRTQGRLKAWTMKNAYDNIDYLGDAREASEEEIEQIKQALMILNKAYEKRLEAYWKRYSNKIRTHGYFANR